MNPGTAESQYPCKHFIAVYSRAVCREWGFSTLPEEYRNTVFITLDAENLGVDEPTRKTADGPQSNSLRGSRGDSNSKASEEIDVEMSNPEEHLFPPKHGNKLHGQTTAQSL